MNEGVSAYSNAVSLVCSGCGTVFGFEAQLLGCPRCRDDNRPGALAVTYRSDPFDADKITQANQFWDYHPLLPVISQEFVISLGEGNTPLLLLDRTASEMQRPVWVKVEAGNPTHSYKDRTNAINVAVARQFGYDKVCCISSGNHGVSMAAYAAAARMRALVLIAPSTPLAIAAEIRHFGADVVVIHPARGSGSVLDLVRRLFVEFDWFISNRNAPLPQGRMFGNPFGLEGYKTIAYEIWHQMGGEVPDWCFMPVGGGDGLVGLWRGFHDLVTLGLAQRVPRMVSCQPAAGASIAAAIAAGHEEVVPVETKETIALSLIDDRSSEQALQAVRESDGAAVMVTDAELLDAGAVLAAHGICVEPSSAASVAGLCQLDRQGRLGSGDSGVVIGTGAGFRWPATFSRQSPDDIKRCAPDVNALQQIIKV